jgi:hypothetical protein
VGSRHVLSNRTLRKAAGELDRMCDPEALRLLLKPTALRAVPDDREARRWYVHQKAAERIDEERDVFPLDEPGGGDYAELWRWHGHDIRKLVYRERYDVRGVRSSQSLTSFPKGVGNVNDHVGVAEGGCNGRFPSAMAGREIEELVVPH